MKHWLQDGILFGLAIFLATIIFVVDYNAPSNLAIGALYSIVIFYTWLLSGKFTSIVFGASSTLLILFCAIFNNEPETISKLNGLNIIISIIVVWISVVLVVVAKKSITGLEEIQIKINKNNKALEEKNKELEQFAYIASHDLQEPLRTINDLIGLIKSKYSGHFDDAGKKCLGFIDDASNRMSLLIKGLLDYSLIGKDPELKIVDCNQLLNTIQADLGTLFSESKTKLIVQELPEINGYETELRTLFQNLITNAIKFNKNEIPIVNISVIKKQNYWQFKIADNGIGIKEKNLDKIFMIFKRIHGRTLYEGNGIGLAHCKKIIELHKGDIWVTSIFGKGTEFYFTIPIKL